MNNVMRKMPGRNPAVGCQIIIGGKVRGQRAKAQKYLSGYLISTGQPKKEFVDSCIRHVHMRQGVLGIKVKIMRSLERKQQGKAMKVMPDYIKIHDPKDMGDEDIVPSVKLENTRMADGHH